MYKIKINDAVQNSTQMKIGDIAVILNGKYKNNYILKMNVDLFIDLTDTSDYWIYDPEFPVRILSKGESITLTVE